MRPVVLVDGKGKALMLPERFACARPEANAILSLENGDELSAGDGRADSQIFKPVTSRVVFLES